MTRTMRVAGVVCATGLLLLSAGCEGSPTGGGGGLPIVISATWTDAHDPDHTVTFRSPDDGRTSGVVTGTEDHDDCADPCPLGGFWADGRIEITILRDSGRPKFVANYTWENPTELTFTQVGGGGSFTLEQ
ncbi:MAG: hypothetical protein WD737_14460 [Gemmatimonadota bacterium]